ncbi:MAG: sulfatase [Verrucomicrobiales bacterium]|nr:sulfatase [Verrucomicrobiales bacterium]|tara:strand:+ start:561 stop:1859 length:1299 start_codon:yes stop_codon:yes gene_type:complete
MQRVFFLLAICLLPLLSIAKPPNIVFIISDDQTWTDYSFMGHKHIQTPNIDKLAAESLTFTHGYVPSSLCCPSLATMITGLYPHQSKITGNEPPVPPGGKRTPIYRKGVEELVALIDDVPTLPRLLKAKGYRSHQSGKWWHGSYKRGGFTHGMTHGDPARGGRHGDEGLKIGREGLEPIFDFIKESGDKPFFLWYAPFLPHTPHTPPQRLFDKYKTKTDSPFIAKYWAMCEWFDETVGDLVKHIDDKAPDTLIIYVTDNGWIQSPKSRGYDLKSKRSQYDGGTRTPLMLRWPGKIKPAKSTIPVSSIDMAPTALLAAGLKPTKAMRGLNLLDAKAVQARKFIYGEIFLHNAVDLHQPIKNITYRWGIKDGWKVILPHALNVRTRAGKGARGNGEVELYHLAKDSFETKNLANENIERIAELRELVNEAWHVK